MRKLICLLLIASLCLPTVAGISFNKATPDWLSSTSFSGLPEPFTVYVQATTTDVTVSQIALGLGDDTNFTIFAGAGFIDSQGWGTVASSGQASAKAGTAVNGTWHVIIAGVDTGANLDVRATLDGASAATDVGAGAFAESLIDVVAIGNLEGSGGSSAGTPLGGTVGLSAIYAGDHSTDGSVSPIGWPPYMAPGDLIFFCTGTFDGTIAQDVVGGVVLTIGNGAPVSAGHKPLVPWPGMQ